MFDFEIKDIPENKYTAANNLFKRLATKEELYKEILKKNINDFIDTQMNLVNIVNIIGIGIWLSKINQVLQEK